jgi:hypothetical protein
MRAIKSFGLPAALAALALASWGGASAYATGYTALCKEDSGTICPANKLFAQVTFVGEMEFLTSLVNDSCLIGLTTTAKNQASPLGSPLQTTAKFEYLTCEKCEFVETATEPEAVFLRTTEELATVTFTSEFLVECPVLHCVYEWTGVAHGLGSLLAALEGGQAHLKASEITLEKIRGFFCPATSKLDIALVSGPKMYIRT